ncbi:2-amino-4-hydroxy-6-hydroxymethyldihydropteridine diphosphokinase [Methylophilus sp. 14]|uniref:2-amino-4-hydroxy-6- hydroxymethyldihydropteridine diphosphokinase n=1 Tax=Methylophilus sp. 14 TaxID=2781019 RepID=UPI00188F189B|nr:2-amino-4-hydroxy-6-hydroxymethyldihydropteridine diphosphokinase [Methylophilus sp. 14]MBF4988032.1 2-amino-4-hydroxy-6-hydroxymethyldihydropteridine diphosphokinase [Methylophilus sp. 14]
MATALIALGSNLQQPETQVSNAIAVLASTPGLSLIKASSLYATAPVGYDNQPDFINAVVQVATEIPAPQLMQLLLEIEQTFGRERPFPNAPRILDLDLLDYDGMQLDTELLKLPHPRMHERGFVILPLAEIVPDFMLPQRKTVVEWIAEHPHDDVRKLDSN